MNSLAPIPEQSKPLNETESALHWIGPRLQSASSTALGILRSYLEADYEKARAATRKTEIPGKDRAEARDMISVLVRAIDDELQSRDRRAGVNR